MPKKKDLLDKLCRKPSPKNFTVRDLDLLMGKYSCKKFSGGRGSGIGFVHDETKRVLQFDQHIQEMNCIDTKLIRQYNF